jgi:hypothetical protein
MATQAAEDAAAFRKLCREQTGDALDVLVKVMKDERCPQNTRVLAATTIIEHAWGKAPQPIGGGDDGTGPIDVIHRIERAIIGGLEDPHPARLPAPAGA